MKPSAIRVSPSDIRVSPSDIRVSPSDIELEPAPINPDWILAGTPTARYRLLWASRDSMSRTVVWDCTEGRFNWYYGCDETVHVIEGGVTLTDSSGTRRIEAGDVVFFPAGSHAMWHVDAYIRKVAFLRSPVPGPIGTAMRAARKLGIARLVRRLQGRGRGQGPANAGALMT